MIFFNQHKLSSYLLLSIAASFVWTLIIAGFLFFTVKSIYTHTEEISKSEARAFFQEIVTTRSWNAFHGGVYVPITDQTRPNPYLEITNRDVTTTDGLKLTKINPAYMTRQIGELAFNKNLVWFHLTSLKPIRPDNSPDIWELKALEKFSKELTEYFEFIKSEDGKRLFRYMAPLWVESSCLKCHAKQGYKEGDIRGGISVNIRADSILNSQKKQAQAAIITNVILWIMGGVGIFFSLRSLSKEEEKREAIIQNLQQALKDVKKLSGLVPICSSCKKIRDDKGYWNQIEVYIHEHTDAKFSHGICQECAKIHYPDLDLYED